MARLLALVADLALVILFVVIGRATHGGALDLEGLQRTGLPFLAGTLMAWVGFMLKRQTGLTLRNGLIVWAMTLVLGLTFRLLIGDTAEIAFVIVAALVLAAFLIGWRFILWLLRRNKQAAPKPKDPRRSGNPAKRAGA